MICLASLLIIFSSTNSNEVQFHHKPLTIRELVGENKMFHYLPVTHIAGEQLHNHDLLFSFYCVLLFAFTKGYKYNLLCGKLKEAKVIQGVLKKNIER